MSKAERSALMKFATSVSRAPLGGFKHLNPPLTVHKAGPLLPAQDLLDSLERRGGQLQGMHMKIGSLIQGSPGSSSSMVRMYCLRALSKLCTCLMVMVHMPGQG